MRRILSAGLIAAGACFVGSSGALAGPANGLAIDEAANDVGIAQSVHCRPFRHWHPWGFGHGCRRGGVVIHEGVGIRSRVVRSRTGVDVRVRSGESIRSGTSIRSQERTTIRSRTGTGSQMGQGQQGTSQGGQRGGGQQGTSGQTGTTGQTGGSSGGQTGGGQSGAGGQSGGGTGGMRQ